MESDVAAAVASIAQGARGELKITMHDKPAAIDKLARALGMYHDKVDLTSKGQPLTATLIIGGHPGTPDGEIERPPPSKTIGDDGEPGDGDPVRRRRGEP
jgi:hypothetical protein